MLWFIPVAIGGVVAAIALLWPSGASASEGRSDGGSGGQNQRTVGGVTLPEVPAQDQTTTTVINLPDPPVMLGQYRQIVLNDTGSKLCVEIYNSPKPTLTWTKVAAHPQNTTRLDRPWGDWFSPRWTADGETYTGSFTGYYANVYFPPREMVGL